MASYRDLLKKYIPEAAIQAVDMWLGQYSVQLRLRSARRSKMGSYHPPQNGHPHYISVNRDLNTYAFLIILVHEIAHVVVWDHYRQRVRPHGKEWKETFKDLIYPFLEKGIFPDDISYALKKYLQKTYASIVTDIDLTRVLQCYQNEGTMILEDLPYQSTFRIHDGRTFRKLDRLRKRYRCQCLKTQRMYLFNPVAQIIPVDAM
jgi:predicted SprT family Zn-dependent metalloprotease